MTEQPGSKWIRGKVWLVFYDDGFKNLDRIFTDKGKAEQWVSGRDKYIIEEREMK